MLDKPDRTAAIAKGLLRLEEPINELASMAQIMADLLDDVLTGERDEHGYFRIRVSKDQMSNITFAWNNVAVRAADLKKAFYAAGNEGEGK